MYQSQIASNLKNKIDQEMNEFRTKSNLMTLEEQISNAKNKADLISIKQQIDTLQKIQMEKNQQKEKEFQKVLRKPNLKEAGFVNVFSIAMVTGFICGLGICIGYLLYRFGVH